MENNDKFIQFLEERIEKASSHQTAVAYTIVLEQFKKLFLEDAGERKEELGMLHYYEFQERIVVTYDIISEVLLDHPVAIQHERWRDAVGEAIKSIYNLYDEVAIILGTINDLNNDEEIPDGEGASGEVTPES